MLGEFRDRGCHVAEISDVASGELCIRSDGWRVLCEDGVLPKADKEVNE